MTGFCPIDGNPRTIAQYATLGEQLRGACGAFKPIAFYNKLPEVWMTPFVEKLAMTGHHIRHSEGDNPLKNTMEYHAVQHQKFEWLEQAAMRDTDADTFVWMDYGIMHQPGFDSNTVQDFLKRVRKNDLAMPGCWEKKEINDYYPCWRFCGSLFVVPREDVFPLNKCFKALTRIRVRTMRNVTWEINSLAHLELAKVGPHIRWYPGDHNASMLSNYA